MEDGRTKKRTMNCMRGRESLRKPGVNLDGGRGSGGNKSGIWEGGEGVACVIIRGVGIWWNKGDGWGKETRPSEENA